MSNAVANHIVEEITMIYKKVYEDNLVKVLLYGSYARGDYTGYSDIDIVAIVKGDRVSVQEKLKIVDDYASEIGFDNDIIVSAYAIPYNEFEKNKEVLPYYRNIEREGVVYYC